MAISHFIITSLPQDVISKIGLVDVVLNQQYDIAMESNLKFERIPALDGYYLKEKAKFKAYDATLGKYGNEASMDLVWKEQNLANLPISTNVTATWTKGQQDNMLNWFPINQATEFIEIISLTGVNNLKLNGRSVLQGHQLSPRDLLYAIYTTYLEGGGFPYFVVEYKVGKGTALEAATYSFTVNVASIATLTKTKDFSVTGGVITESGTFDTFYHTAEFEVAEGYQGGTAQVDITINCPFLTTADPNVQSEVVITSNGVQNRYTANALVPVTVNLDEKGKGSFTVQHRIIKDEATETGTSTVTLKNINGDIAAVSGTTYTASIVSNA